MLDFKRIFPWGGNVELYFTTGCNGQAAVLSDPRYFTVRENGEEIQDFQIWCPDIHVRCNYLPPNINVR